jgi:HKD family nuclease
MKVEIFHQFPGGQKFINQLKEALGNRKFTKLRVLVAYISWNGIRLVHKELEDFYDRGGKVSMILGIGGELSEPDVMRYLIERLPKAEIYLFYVPVKHFIFHPKIYILNDRISTLAFFGSNNFTVGGLFCNSESYIKSILDNRKDKIQSKEIEKIWDFYLKPCSPFKSENLQKVDQKLINAYIKDKRKLPKVPKSPKPKFLEKIFPAVHIEKPPIVKASAQPRAKKGKKKTVSYSPKTGQGE